MALRGVFDQHPNLQVILGHWGEVVNSYLERLVMLDRVSGLQKVVASQWPKKIFT
ncbi:hypothetical protein [Caballeronia sp. J97]|uniref:hypothetical protein n=1 Tax=Caballeronia sp. J97 TaxID=2805429 RepID=UPI002AB1499A|nr:hypothetical protein [Caballeronia sp. J97]